MTDIEQKPSAPTEKQWNTLGTMAWAFWALFFLAYELFTGIEHKRDIPMLTQFVVRYIPWWIMLPLIGWLFLHFATRYFNPTYRLWLESGGAGG